MDQEHAIKALADELTRYELLPAGENFSYEQLHSAIAERIDFLISSNFSRFLSVLYQLDISEKKLKMHLTRTADTPAAEIIATMIIERQLEKIETRKAFRNSDSCEEEKW